MTRVFIGMETSGQLRRRFQAKGFWVVSCDVLEADDFPGTTIYDGGNGGHWRGDAFDVLAACERNGWKFDFGIFHPTCTYHTVAAAWAFADPNFTRYPGTGYHQKIGPGTLVGRARREARERAEMELALIKALPFPKIVENPRGTISTRTGYGKPADVLQPYEHGDNASKATCIWAFDKSGEPIEFKVRRDPSRRVSGRVVEWPRGSGRLVERWANQTDSGQNNVTPGDDRWKGRSKTYPGIAESLVDAITAQFFTSGSSHLSPEDRTTYGVFA